METTIDRPAAAARCPFTGHGAGYKPFEQEGLHEFFTTARQEQPVFYCEEIGHWVVSRREDVIAVFRNPDQFSAAPALQTINPYPPELVAYLKENNFTIEPVQSNCDRPNHTRIRQAAGQFLNAKRYMSYEPQVRELVQSYIEKMKGKDVVDLVDAINYEFPAQVVFLMMGIKDIEPRQLKRWAQNRVAMTWGYLPQEQMLDAGKELNSFFQFCRQIVEDRKRNPGDDYPSKLLAIRNNDDAILTENEVVCLLFALLLAAHEATTNALTNLQLQLLSHKDAWKRLVADPSLIPNALEEGFRHSSSVINWRRQALEDVEVGGVTIPKGGKVILALCSANRDESKFENPHEFDIDRPNVREHIAFGQGIHVCLGAPMVRIQMKAVMEALVANFPDMALVEGQKLDWLKTITFRGPRSLMVHLGGKKNG